VVSLESDIENQTNIRNSWTGKIFKHGYQVQKFIIMCIRKPTAYRHSMLRVEDVGCRGIVDDNGVLEIPTDLRQIFDVVALMVVAALSEEAVMHDIVNVKLVQ
jgi:hypothetical protein